MNTNKISYNKYVAEIIGTLMLVLVVALSGAGLSAIIFAGMALAFAVYLFGDVSGAHVNPAFTIAAFTMKKIKWQDAVLYICAQLIGASIALIVLKSLPGFTFTDIGAISGLTTLTIFKSEIVGAIIYAFAFSAMVHGKTTKSNVGLVVGMGLFFGLLAANIITGGVGILNPAVSIGTNMINWATIVGPIVGALIGAWLYRFIVLGNFCGCHPNCEGTCTCGFCHKKSKNNTDIFEAMPVETMDVPMASLSEPVIIVEKIEVIN